MFSKKKKKPQISLPTSFVHRVHTGYDKREGRYVGLPPQWASIVGNNQILKSTNRPLPLVDPSEITPTEILDLKTIVRHNSNANNNQNDEYIVTNGINLPKTSNVARSNSLRSSSPTRIRRDLRGNANVPPVVPEEPVQTSQQPNIQQRDAIHTSKSSNEWPNKPVIQPSDTANSHSIQSNNGNINFMTPVNVHTEMPSHLYRSVEFRY